MVWVVRSDDASDSGHGQTEAGSLNLSKLCMVFPERFMKTGADTNLRDLPKFCLSRSTRLFSVRVDLMVKPIYQAMLTDI